MKTSLCAALCLCVVALSQAQESNSHSATKPLIVNIVNSEGQHVGTAILSPAPKGVKIVLDIKNLPPGQHSIHIHQNGKCTPPQFNTSGPHFEGGQHNHSAGPAGDIPDFMLTVGPDRTAHVTTIAPNVTLGDDDHSVFSNGGTSLIIHAASSEVTSGAPPRIACGVIAKPA